MNYRAIPILPENTVVAALLHHAAAFPEPWSANSFAELLAMPGTTGRFAVSGDGDSPFGLVLWRVAADEAEILTICVLPAERRRGVARFLLEQALAELRTLGIQRVFLEVAVDNEPAAALYRALGFRATGSRPAYYRGPHGPIDAAIFIKDDL